MVTSRDKDITTYLLDHFKIPHLIIGKNRPSKIGKIYSLIRNDLKIFQAARTFDPDVVVGFFSPYAAHAGKLLGKPVIGFHDTEHANLSIKLAKPFTDCLVVPSCYTRGYKGKKIIKFNGYFELSYLHPNYFKPDPSVLNSLKIGQNEKYTLIRFVSHSAVHDTGNPASKFSLKMVTIE